MNDAPARPLLFALPGNEDMASKLAACLDAEVGEVETRHFPDEETYLRLGTSPAARSVVLVATLDRPDSKFLSLVFAAAAARQLGAVRIGLIAPYLCYLRQDKRFRPGEAVTSEAFARHLSQEIDWLVTVDPHLHRYDSLDAIYPIPTRIAEAAPALAEWIGENVDTPHLIGPDTESEQWVARVAAAIDAPYAVLSKERLGDNEVRVRLPDIGGLAGGTPVLVDDIVSSAQTMIETARLLREQGLPPPACVAVHGLFAASGFADLMKVAASVVTTNTVSHVSNRIDLSHEIAAAADELIGGSVAADGTHRQAAG